MKASDGTPNISQTNQNETGSRPLSKSEHRRDTNENYKR